MSYPGHRRACCYFCNETDSASNIWDMWEHSSDKMWPVCSINITYAGFIMIPRHLIQLTIKSILDAQDNNLPLSAIFCCTTWPI